MNDVSGARDLARPQVNTDARISARNPAWISRARIRREDGTNKDARLLDLSTTGCQLATPLECQVGAWVWLSLPGMPPLRAEVAWRRHGHLGCRFEEELMPHMVNSVTLKEF